MFSPSPDTPAYYLTSVTHNRLHVFRKDLLASVACEALNEARASGGFLLFAYVLTPDHLHVVTDSAKRASEIQRFINGIIGRRVIDFLKQSQYSVSLRN